MSVAAIARVWSRSTAKGSELLVLLALADYADDDGRNAWPSVMKLAEKSRMTDRGVRDILRRLVASGELSIEKNLDGREVRGGHKPRVFMHVLCCAEPEKFSEKPEKISGRKAEKFSGRSEKISDPNGGDTAAEPEPGRTRIKEDPSEIRQKDHTTGAREVDPRRAHPLDEPLILEPAAVRAFDELWALYPRKAEGRVSALRAWHALQPSAEQAAYIVEALRVRIRFGWARDTPPRFLPSLRTFLDEGRWLQPYTPPAALAPVPAAPDGFLVMRSCPHCGATQEGQIVNGHAVYPACACAVEASV